MTPSDETLNKEVDTGSIDKEDIRCGYTNAINLWTYEGNSFWNKISAMITTNAIIFATIGIILTVSRWHDLWGLIPILSSLGIFLCVCWFIIIRRSFIYYNYWIISSRNLEKQISNVNTIQHGKSFLNIKNMVKNKEDKNDQSKLNILDKFTIICTTKIILLVFILTYVIIMIFIKDIK
jgi:hypothetical protein